MVCDHGKTLNRFKKLRKRLILLDILLLVYGCNSVSDIASFTKLFVELYACNVN